MNDFGEGLKFWWRYGEGKEAHGFKRRENEIVKPWS
jgi:hypothetical protein